MDNDALSNPPSTTSLLALLGSPENYPATQYYLSALEMSAGRSNPAGRRKETRAYKDVRYSSYAHLGISLQYEPNERGRDAMHCISEQVRLAAIDLYSEKHLDRSSTAKGWMGFPALPLSLSVYDASTNEPKRVSLTEDTTGQNFVEQLGEPARKGGGGADVLAAMGPAAWMEWQLTVSTAHETSAGPAPQPSRSRIKLMVELGGQAARTSDRWDPSKGGAATCKTLTIIADDRDQSQSQSG